VNSGCISTRTYSLGEKLLKPFWVCELLETVVERYDRICRTKAWRTHISIYINMIWSNINDQYQIWIYSDWKWSLIIAADQKDINDFRSDQWSIINDLYLMISDHWSDMISDQIYIFINIYIIYMVFFDLRYLIIDLISIYHYHIIIDLKWSDIYL
jgi:hypothetical protein